MGILRHGHTRRTPTGRVLSPEYRAYTAMKNRCLNPRQARFKDYGARGITICDRWLNGESGLTGFECFLADVGQKPSLGHTLERSDNDDGYRPGNVRWATRAEQNRNKRDTRMVDVCGCEVPFIEAAERWGVVPYRTAYMRVRRGWGPERAIFTPLGQTIPPVALAGLRLESQP